MKIYKYYSAIESRSVILAREDVPLKELLLKIVSKYNVQLTISGAKPVEIIVDEDNNFETLVLITDRRRITQIFDKLLSNAVKFTNEGRITISYEITCENITFYISDTGIGIPNQEYEQIFNSFSHGYNLYVTLHKGVGLGLNIVKLLIEVMGGTLSFKSEEGKGSVFSVTFPSVDIKNYTINGNHVVKNKPLIKGRQILIAEDNDESFRHMESILSPYNEIVRAKTGSEAVTMTENGINIPDVIIMDIIMPEMDGVTASQLIRKQKPFIPIIGMSSSNQIISGNENFIFNAVITKPILSQQLTDTINELLPP